MVIVQTRTKDRQPLQSGRGQPKGASLFGKAWASPSSWLSFLLSSPPSSPCPYARPCPFSPLVPRQGLQPEQRGLAPLPSLGLGRMSPCRRSSLGPMPSVLRRVFSSCFHLLPVWLQLNYAQVFHHNRCG